VKPFFPPPPKAEAPYRKGASRVVDDDEPEKPELVATRPEPPPAPPAPGTKVPKSALGSLVHVPKRELGSGPTNPLLLALVKWPRPFGGVLFFVSAFLFYAGARSIVAGDWVVRRALTMRGLALFAGAGLWIALWGLVFDDEKSEVPTWWWVGLALFAIGGAISYDMWLDVIRDRM
jgi:hypothetical protein